MSDTAAPNILLGETVRVHNNELYPLKLDWNSTRYVVPPQGDAYLPFDCIKLYFGDPRATDHTLKVPNRDGTMQIIADRTTQIALLRQYWTPTSMATPGSIHFREFIPEEAANEPISDRIPSVEIYTLAGDRIYTVVDDPRGDRVIAAVPTRSDRDAQEQVIAQQAARMAEMEEQMKRYRADMEVLMKRLGERPANSPEDPQDLGPDLPLPNPAFPSGSVEENPSMVLNPRTNKIQRRPRHVTTPQSLEDLPSDQG
jgi:uncharacterized coiled-coil protein SlyX